MAIHKCPHCNGVIELSVRMTKAPPMQSDQAKPANGNGSELEELLNAINEDSLTDPGLSFVRQTRERFAKYGAKTQVSEKQMAWLRKLAGEKSGSGDEW